MIKKIIIGIIIIAAAIGVFFYATRPVSAPTQDINDTTTEKQSDKEETVYRIKQENSQAKFTIKETLRGEPFTAVGITNQIAGNITVSNDALEIGTLTINAKTFKTDSAQRDGAIARFILKSDQTENEFITFKPTLTKQTSATTATVTGDLTISGITKPTTFLVTTDITDDTINGTATATLKRSDFKLTIPNIPFVANVSDTFTVSAKIVAEKI